MDDGFLRLSRKFFSNELWKEAREFSECEAWLDLIQSARFEATDKAYSELIGGREISYSRGQYPASISFLTKRWKWSDKKVRYFLTKLKKKGMITVDNKQGMNVITLCNYDEYNPVKGKDRGIDNDVGINDINTSLGKLKGELLEAIEKMGQARGNKKKKEEENNNQEISATADTKKAAAAKSWRDDFEIYKSELKDAFDKIISDESFIEDRQKYHPNVDILLSLQKAYEDYWSTEAGWKKKKASKTKEIDWKSTFRKALDQPQNKVYKQKVMDKQNPQRAMSELQEKFAKYLKEHAPMLLQMPLQPTDEEIKALKGAMRIEVLLDLIKKINNDKYLTTRKNSVFQTIMELKQKEYGT